MRAKPATLAIVALLAISAPVLAQDAWVPKGTADLVLLDKISGQPTDVSVKVGDSTVFGSLTIAVNNCVVRPPDQPEAAASYVDVTDTRGQTDIFHGWILAKTPALSQMEHPVYDLKLTGCR